MRSHPSGLTVQILPTALCFALCCTPLWGQQIAEPSAVGSSLELDVYGYIKLDAAYDTARTVPGSFVKWVDLAAENDHDNAFNMTANQSRIGLKIGERVPSETEEEPRIETSGRIEVDAFGGGAPNKAGLMLRHAYLRVLWTQSNLELLAGQTSDLISPLNPQTLNYSVAWWAGNIGYRRPQLRVTKRIDLAAARCLELGAALAGTIGATHSEFTGNDAGADSGLPSLQGRVGVRLPRGSAYGLSGHWGQEEYDLSAAGEEATFDSWSINLDARQRLAPKLVLQAEAFTGVNLQTYLGGVGNGVELSRLQEIAANGGWFSFDLGPYESWSFHLGASVDDPRDEHLETGARSRNRSIFANGVWALTDRLEIGGEISEWVTEYKDIEEATAVRGQLSFIYRF